MAAIVSAAGATHAQTGPVPAQLPGDGSAELQHWLTRIHDAAAHSNYVGTLVSFDGTSAASSRVQHYCDGRNTLERIDALDGEARGMLRVNDEVRTLWPRLKVAIVEPVDPRASFPSLVSGSEQHIPDFYELHVQPSDRVAGHDADRLLLKARDAARFDHLIWVDHATGLLLRVDVQVDGRTLESSAFSDVKIGVRPEPGQIYNDAHRVDSYHIFKRPMQSTKLDAEGWQMDPKLMPSGFHSLGCVRRTLPMPGSEGSQATVVQAIFSDGLTDISLFIEPYQPQRHQNPGATEMGATHTLTVRIGDTWLTAVGDVPAQTLDRLTHAIGRKP